MVQWDPGTSTYFITAQYMQDFLEMYGGYGSGDRQRERKRLVAAFNKSPSAKKITQTLSASTAGEAGEQVVS
jgi:hypothetical protein